MLARDGGIGVGAPPWNRTSTYGSSNTDRRQHEATLAQSIARIGKRLRKEFDGTGGYPRVQEGTPIGTTCPNSEPPLAV